MAGKNRVGGLRVDPQTKDWLDSAAENTAALTKQQRKDRGRVRLRVECERYPWLKEAIEEAAFENNTSASQMAAFLMAWALRLYHRRDVELVDALLENKEPARTLRFDRNVNIPRAVERDIRAAMKDDEEV